MATASDGGYLEPDSSPYTGTSLTWDSGGDAIHDTTLYTAASSNTWDQYYSYGIDLGATKTVTTLTVSCDVPAPGVTPAAWTANGGGFKVLGTDSKGSWTDIEDFSDPTQDHQGVEQLGFDLTFSSQQTYRYFKVVATEADGCKVTTDGADTVCKIGEIAYTEAPSLIIDSCAHLHYVDHVVWTPLGDLSTYHLHYADNVSLVPVLDVASTYHTHIADSPTLTYVHVLISHDTYHNHFTTWPIKLDVPSTTITADLTIPFIEIETSFGMHADLTIPMIEIDASIVPTDEISIDLTIPMIEISAEMVSAANIDVDLTIPMIEISSSIVKGNNITGDLTIPMIEISTSIGSNNLITGSLTIPMIVVNSSIANDPPTIILKHSRY